PELPPQPGQLAPLRAGDNRADAGRCPAAAGMLAVVLGRIAVIVGQLLTRLNSPAGLDPDVPGLPFGDAIGLTAMIDQPRRIPGDVAINIVPLIELEDVHGPVAALPGSLDLGMCPAQ